MVYLGRWPNLDGALDGLGDMVYLGTHGLLRWPTLGAWSIRDGSTLGIWSTLGARRRAPYFRETRPTKNTRILLF